MAGWSDGYRADLVRRRLTPELISSLPGTAGLPPFISFSTSYRELDSAETTQERYWVRASYAPRFCITKPYSLGEIRPMKAFVGYVYVRARCHRVEPTGDRRFGNAQRWMLWQEARPAE